MTVTNYNSITFAGSGMSGELPSSWSALTGLTSIYIQLTQLTGELPSSWKTAQLTGLTEM